MGNFIRMAAMGLGATMAVPQAVVIAGGALAAYGLYTGTKGLVETWAEKKAAEKKVTVTG